MSTSTSTSMMEDQPVVKYIHEDIDIPIKYIQTGNLKFPMYSWGKDQKITRDLRSDEKGNIYCGTYSDKDTIIYRHIFGNLPDIKFQYTDIIMMATASYLIYKGKIVSLSQDGFYVSIGNKTYVLTQEPYVDTRIICRSGRDLLYIYGQIHCTVYMHTRSDTEPDKTYLQWYAYDSRSNSFIMISKPKYPHLNITSDGKGGLYRSYVEKDESSFTIHRHHIPTSGQTSPPEITKKVYKYYDDNLYVLYPNQIIIIDRGAKLMGITSSHKVLHALDTDNAIVAYEL